MQRALLVSLLVATALIPLAAARARSTRRALAWTAIAMATFCLVYWAALLSDVLGS